VVVNAGEELGFDIVGVTPGLFNREILRQSDVIILNNCFQFQPEQFRDIQYELYENLKPYVKYEHDYRELKRQNISRPLFERSILNVFISPAHAKRMCEGLNLEQSDSRPPITRSLPLAIDLHMFNEQPVGRDPKKVLVPVFHKGNSEMADYINHHPEYSYIILGQVDVHLEGKIEHKAFASTDEMPGLYSQCGKVLHLPHTHWAGDRVLFEAVLCGCEVITNEHAGRSSWAAVFDWTDEAKLRTQLEVAPYLFWRDVEKCLCTYQ